jgi:queuine/archaeosine tRNA-ribosyltransferase
MLWRGLFANFGMCRFHVNVTIAIIHFLSIHVGMGLQSTTLQNKISHDNKILKKEGINNALENKNRKRISQRCGCDWCRKL